MPILPSEIVYRLSGGPANADPNASLGGPLSTVAGGIVPSDMLNNLWDDVNGDEAVAGDAEYRAIYVQNLSPTLALQAPKLWIEVPSPSPKSEIDVALAPEGLNGEMEAVADESTTPPVVAFTRPFSKASGVSLPELPPSGFCGIWLRRTIDPSAGALNESPAIRVEGDSNP